MEVKLTPLQLNNILEFAGKGVTKLLDKTINSIGSKGAKIVTQYDEIDVSSPINMYNMVSKSMLNKVLKERGIDDEQLQFLKDHELVLKVRQKAIEFDLEDMYVSEVIESKKIDVLKVKRSDLIDDKVKLILTAVIQIIVREIAPNVLLCFDVIKNKDVNVISAAVNAKVPSNTVLLEIRGHSDATKLLLYFVVIVKDKPYDQYVLCFDVRRAKKEDC
jgi:hypothetical protein